MINKVILLSILIFAINSCRKDPISKFEKFDPAPCSDTIYFNQEVQLQIVDVSCNVSNCHDSVSAAHGLDYSSHEKIVPLTHGMYKSMAHDSGFIPMPSAEVRLPDSLLQKFYCWIQQGRLDN